MTKRSKFLLPLGALLAIALGLGAGSLQAGDDVPFQGIALTQFVSEDLVELTALYEILDGNASHLGKIEGMAVVSYVQISEDPPIYVPAGAEIVFVAANGDELYMETGAFGYEVTGGTGRFDGATGDGEFETTVIDIDEGLVEIEWNGTIDYKKK
jgi:hypothetical protein